MQWKCLAISALAVAVMSPSLAAQGAPTGLAWDSVTRLTTNADPSTLQPGSFDDDFAAASAVQMPDQGSGSGFFAQMHQAMNMGKGLSQLMQSGFAEHHYVAGAKERVDQLAMQTATITDCAARTITTLDLRKKTYKVVSMDQPASSGSGGGGGGGGGSPARSNDTISHVAIAVTNTALGARTVGGLSTTGYRSDMTITVTRTSGESTTQNGQLLGYYSTYANPSPSCSRSGAPAGPNRIGMMARYAQLMQVLAAAGVDKRFSVQQSGPAIPLGQLAMYSALTFEGGGRGSGATFVTERGHIRPLPTDDAAFSIPAGFTQEQ